MALYEKLVFLSMILDKKYNYDSKINSLFMVLWRTISNSHTGFDGNMEEIPARL